MPARSDSERDRLQPWCKKIFFILVPWSMPISRYSLPYGFIHLWAFFAIDLYAPRPLSFAYSAIFGSWVAALFTRGSFCAIYGGFETIMSNFLPKSCGWSNVACFVFIFASSPSVFMLWRATCSARCDLSMASPPEFAMFFTSAQIMQPVPVPRSSMRNCALFV